MRVAQNRRIEKFPFGTSTARLQGTHVQLLYPFGINFKYTPFEWNCNGERTMPRIGRALKPTKDFQNTAAAQPWKKDPLSQ